jgi:hypothetical protein
MPNGSSRLDAAFPIRRPALAVADPTEREQLDWPHNDGRPCWPRANAASFALEP